MSRVIDIMRQVVEQEVTQHQQSALAVVSAIYPHGNADDDNNHEADVQLKHDGLTLTRVPIAVTHMGMVVPPKIGDLALVQFINGDINQPIITGLLYHDQNRPPLYSEDDVLYEQRVSDDTINQLRFSADGSIYLQRDVSKPEDNSAAKASIKIDVDGNIEIKAGENTVVTLNNDGNIEIDVADKDISMHCNALTVKGNVNINGDLDVSNGSNGTTIRGNEITGR